MSKPAKFVPTLPSVSTVVPIPTPTTFKPITPIKTPARNKGVTINYVFIAMPLMAAYNYIITSNSRNIATMIRSGSHKRRIGFSVRRIIDPIRNTMILSEDNHGTPNWVMIKVEAGNHVLMMKPAYRSKWTTKEPVIIRMDDPNSPNIENMALVQTMTPDHRNVCPIFVDMYEKDERLAAFCVMRAMLIAQIEANGDDLADDALDLDVSESADEEIDDGP
jgi:hypothetical protein